MSKALIYVIEDDPIFTRLFKEVLEKHRFTNVRFFESGEEALATIKKKPAAVFLDFSLGGLNGLDVMERIKKKYSKIKVFIITSINDPVVKQKCLEAGADAFIEKTEKGLEEVESKLFTQIKKPLFSFLG